MACELATRRTTTKVALAEDCPSHVHFMLVVTRRLAVSFTMLESLSERHSVNVNLDTAVLDGSWQGLGVEGDLYC